MQAINNLLPNLYGFPVFLFRAATEPPPRRFGIALLTVTGQRLVLELRKLSSTADLSTRSRADREVDRALQGFGDTDDEELVFEMNPYASYSSATQSRYARPHADAEYEEVYVPVAGPSHHTDENATERRLSRTREYG